MTDRVLIFDIDDTLLDYEAAERGIWEAIFRDHGLALSEDDFQRNWAISWETWKEAGMMNITDPDVQASYEDRYRQAVLAMMEGVRDYTGIRTSAAELAEQFEVFMSRQFTTFPEVEQVLWDLHRDGYRIFLASNGHQEVQTARMAVFADVVDGILTSELAGIPKPGAAFFRELMEMIHRTAGCTGILPKQCLFIGDSIHSDMIGAHAAGMDTCLVDRKGKYPDLESLPEEERASVRFIVKDLRQLMTIKEL